MGGLSRPNNARRTGNVATLRTSKSQPTITAESSRLLASGRPASAGGGGGTTRPSLATKNRHKVKTRNSNGRVAGKVLTWFRLPVTEGWVPTARAGHTAVTVGTDMIIFGGIVNGQRVDELARFDLTTRVWHRLDCRGARSLDSGGGTRGPIPTMPSPRAFHVSWEFGVELYVHGGEGPPVVLNTDINSGGSGQNVDLEFDDILEGAGRDPFADEDGGAPLERGRVVLGGGVPVGNRVGLSRGQQKRQSSQQQEKIHFSVTILEDLWKLDTRTLKWQRISSRLAPLGRKGHSATVAPLCDESHVFIFGGAPRGRLGLSNALYSIELLRLSSGEGIWKRHRPGGAVPPARQGHSFTVVGGGRRLVLYGGVGESGDLLNDVQILDIDGGRFSWAQLQTPVGDMPTARHGHSACEVPASACYAAGVSSGLGCVLVFGGEGRTGAGLEDVRPTDSHELFLYDPQASRWHTINIGHAFPIGRHAHSMAVVAGWTPPSFCPDGTLKMPEASPKTPGISQHNLQINKRQFESEAATYQWGIKPPKCLIIFGGLNSMYINPEVWFLPLRWRDNSVQLCPPRPEAGENTPMANLSFATGGMVVAVAANAAARAHAKTAATRCDIRARYCDERDDSWRLWKGGGGEEQGVREGRRGEESGVGRLGVGKVAVAPFARGTQQRRASLPAAGLTAHGFNTPPGQDTVNVDGDIAGAAGVRFSDDGNHIVGRRGGDGGMETIGDSRFGAGESAQEVEAELLRLRKATYVAEQKLSAEVLIRMQLEEAKEELQKELERARTAKEITESHLREEAKRHWHDGQKAKARCGNLERLLAEAYELLNMAELQHHLQIRSLMPGLYGNSQKISMSPPPASNMHQHPAGQYDSENIAPYSNHSTYRSEVAREAGGVKICEGNQDRGASPRRHHRKNRYRGRTASAGTSADGTVGAELLEGVASIPAVPSAEAGDSDIGLD